MKEPRNKWINGVLHREKTGQPLITTSLREDMLDWSRKISSLASCIQNLSFSDQNPTISALGEIINDFTNALDLEISKLSEILDHIDDTVIFPRQRIEEVFAFLHSASALSKSDIAPINYQISNLDNFINNYAIPAMNLKKSFEELKEKIMGIDKE